MTKATKKEVEFETVNFRISGVQLAKLREFASQHKYATHGKILREAIDDFLNALPEPAGIETAEDE